MLPSAVRAEAKISSKVQKLRFVPGTEFDS